MKHSLDTKLAFGKYKKYILEEVVENDPDYLWWCLDNIDWFELDDEAYTKLEKNDDWESNSWRDGYPTEFGNR